MRNFLVLNVCLILTTSTLVQAEEAKKPNILFISIDDQNDWIGCLGGHPQAKTPHIDRIASRGTVFLNAHCQAPLCNPSRTSLMTGRRPSSTGIYGLSPWFRDVPELADLVTLPQHFHANGYTNYSTGKIYHGGYGRKGKDKEFQVLGPPASVGVRPKQKLVNTPAAHPLVDWGVFPHKDEDKGDYHVASWAVKTLNEKPQEPFCLSVGFFLPHVPCYATQEWFDLFPEDELQVPEIIADDRADTPRFSWYLHWKLPEPRLKFLKEDNQWKNLTRSYLACTSFVDAQIGRVIAALEQNGYADNTIIVLWSDHGWHIGEKEITGKNTLWDDGTRVPLIFAGPGITEGQRCTQPAELLDIYPTLSDLTGLKQPGGLEGHSLTPQLKDATTKREFPAITTHNHDNHGIRTENWRFIQYADGSQELYDMRSDPNEWTNLAGDKKYAAVIEDLSKFLPATSKMPAPNSQHRVLTYTDGIAIWEGKKIEKDAPIPEID
ncbi:Choline-sulfatase [Bremerella volcania]|uniref:Choline-sulfatase n=1 Tax=Bremerella volcania TaxID=2527984 RepID=A0A518CBG3_9BACT|nr:sulfatase [Bremerella volcania]QDU76569.1 Choline-sulfatase [Bremerella volcania]